MYANSSALPMYLMKAIGWDPIKDIKKFDEFYFSKKNNNISCITTLRKPKKYYNNKINSHFWGLKFAKFVGKIKTLDPSLFAF